MELYGAHRGGGFSLRPQLFGLAALSALLSGTAILAQDAALPPGIYTHVEISSMDQASSQMQLLIGCTSRPIVFHPDATVISKALVPGAGYAEIAQGKCAVDAGLVGCGGGLVGAVLDQAILTALEDGHFQLTARSGNTSVLGRCDPQTLVAAAPDGSALDAVLSRTDGGVELNPADTVVLAGNDFDAEQFGTVDSMDFVSETEATPQPAGGGNILPPGIYAALSGEYSSAEDMDYDRMMACARRPAVIYPDGRLLLKELDEMAAEIGLAPYRLGFDALCSVNGDVATCDGQAFRDAGGPGMPQSIVGTLASIDGGFSLDSNGRKQTFLACDSADLDQQVDGISVLAEIIRRPDPGPFPDLGGISIDTADLTSMPNPAATPGDWDGTYMAYFSEGLGEVRVDVVHTAENPGQAFASLGFDIGTDSAECARILGAPVCEELELNSGWTESVRGTVIDGERLLIVYEQGLWQSGVERELRLVELVRNREGGFRLTRVHPVNGADLVIEGIYGSNFCETGQYSIVDMDCSQLGVQRIGLASGAASDAELKGLFETAPERVAPLLALLSAQADTEIETVANVASGSIETGPWHGAFTIELAETGLQFGVDIAQPIGVSHAWAEIFANALGDQLNCVGIDPVACSDYMALASGPFETLGTFLSGNRALVAIELSGFVAGDSRLRLLEIDRNGTSAELKYYHPSQGLLFAGSAEQEPHWCDDIANAPDGFCADTRSAMAEMVFSDGLQFVGVFGQINADVDQLLGHAQPLAGLMAQPTAPAETRTASSADWGGLPPGIWTNLMGYDREEGLLARSCLLAPSISYADGTIISKERIGDRYAIQSIFSCLPQAGGGLGCDVSDGVEVIAGLSSIEFRPSGATTEICYGLDGENYCDTLHQCTSEVLPADQIQSIIARHDGGVPLALR